MIERVRCDYCDGSGGAPPGSNEDCEKCGGSGEVTVGDAMADEMRAMGHTEGVARVAGENAQRMVENNPSSADGPPLWKAGGTK